MSSVEKSNKYPILRNKEYIKKLSYYDSLFCWDIENIKHLDATNILKYVFSSKKYEILYSSLSPLELRKKIEYDIEAINQLDNITEESKILKTSTLLGKIAQIQWLNNLEYINYLRYYKDEMKILLKRWYDLGLDISPLINRLNYYSMIYDYYFFIFYWGNPDDKISIKKIKERWNFIIDNSSIPEFYWTNYWLHNDDFIKTVNNSLYIKYTIELIYFLTWRTIFYKKHYLYLDEIKENLFKFKNKRIWHLYYLVIIKQNLLQLWFWVRHSDWDIFSKLNNKLYQLLNNTWDDWMEWKIEEWEELIELRNINKKNKQAEIQSLIELINKWEWIDIEFKSNFSINPFRLIEDNDTTWTKIIQWGSTEFLETIVSFLNGNWGFLLVWIWEKKQYTNTQKLKIAHGDNRILIDERIDDYIITWIEHDLIFEQCDFDWLKLKIQEAIKKYIFPHPSLKWDDIIIEKCELLWKTICKINIPRWKKYYVLQKFIKDETGKTITVPYFYKRNNHGKEKIEYYEVDDYKKMNPR